MDRTFFYFKQPVAYTELNGSFDDVENAIKNLLVDYGLTGIINPTGTPGDGPLAATADNVDTVITIVAGIAYDPLGNRIHIPSTQTQDIGQDSNSVSTAVSTAGHTKIVSLCAQFERTLSDPRTDGNAITVYFEQTEGYELVVVQGTEGVSPTPPAIPSGAQLLGDFTRTYGSNAVTTGNTSYARVPYAIDPGDLLASEIENGGTSGVVINLAAGTLAEQIQTIWYRLDNINEFGVPPGLIFSNIASLRAFTPVAEGAAFVIGGYGPFVYDAASAATDDGITCIQPSSVSGSGRWLSLTASLNVANGLPQLDGTARLAAALSHLGTVEVLTSVKQGLVVSSVLSNSGGALPNVETSTAAGGTQVGDILVILCSWATQAVGGNSATVELVAADHGGTLANVGSQSGGGALLETAYVGGSLTAAATGMFVASWVVGTAGGTSVQLFAGQNGTNVNVAGDLTVIHIRP